GGVPCFPTEAKLVRPARIELATLGLGVPCSIQFELRARTVFPAEEVILDRRPGAPVERAERSPHESPSERVPGSGSPGHRGAAFLRRAPEVGQGERCDFATRCRQRRAIRHRLSRRRRWTGRVSPCRHREMGRTQPDGGTAGTSIEDPPLRPFADVAFCLYRTRPVRTAIHCVRQRSRPLRSIAAVERNSNRVLSASTDSVHVLGPGGRYAVSLERYLEA